MANWNYDPRLRERSEDPAVRELQQAMMAIARKLRVAMREVDADNIAPDFLPSITNAEKAELQVVKGKAANAYIGNDGELFKIVDGTGGTGGTGTIDPLSVMPVGYVYISTSSTSPQTLFGGTWERIEGRFLLAADSTYTAGSTGGEATHKLTVAEMPTHNHYVPNIKTTGSDVGNAYAESWGGGSGSRSIYVDNAGGGMAHNNMPLYFAVYMWMRTA